MKYRSKILLSSFTPIHIASLSFITMALIFALIPKYAISAQVTLSWDANPEDNIDHYTVYYGRASRDYDFNVDVGRSTSATISGLEMNESYFFALTASDDAGNESAFSSEVSTSFGPVELIAPNGGETISSGSVYTVEWETVPEAEYFKLRYSLDEGREWTTISNGVAGTTYDWDVPTPRKNSKNCLMKVIAYDADDNRIASSKSDSSFTIEVVRITSPSSGDILTSGDTYSIEWDTYETTKEIAKVVLKYTKNGGKTWKKINTIRGQNPGNYLWTVPDVSNTKTKCKVKVKLKDNNGKSLGSDASNAYFTIEP